jgi:glycosyltransferase involved in cell wall biosynthesis
MNSPQTTSKWLLLEAYAGGSHARLVDGLVEHLMDRVEFEVWRLPARKWKWRMRGSALHYLSAFSTAELADFDGVFVTSMCNAAELRGLLPIAWSQIPWVVYFHENQLRYPVAHFDSRDHHFAWTNVVTALAGDRLLFNSAYNRDSFLEDLAALLAKMPDARPTWILDAIAERAEVLTVPIDECAVETRSRRGPCRIVWNHRWEFDKGPEALLRACQEIAQHPAEEVQVSVVGQSFQERPPAFDRIPELLGPRLTHFGHLDRRADYLELLASADVVLSTAEHEFQGLAVLEGALHGAVPLVPDDLAYRELWPSQWRYARADLATALRDRIVRRKEWRSEDPVAVAQKYTWPEMRDEWARVFGAG